MFLGSSSAQHKGFSTVHSALAYVIKPAWHIPVPNVQWKTPDDWQRNCPKHVEFLDKNKFGKISASVGFIKKKLECCFFVWICKSYRVLHRLDF